MTSSHPVPHFRIQPAVGWIRFDLRELWMYRDLFLILMLRDVQIRYKQTVLGVIWVILQPLAAAGIFSIIFGRFAKLPSEGVPYGLYVFVAMLPWNLFSGALQRTGSGIISDARLISKVYFPRVILPASKTCAVLVDFLVAFALGLVLMLAYDVTPTWRIVLVPAFVLLTLLLTLGVGLLFSGLNVYYRDFMYALPFLVQIWLYLSPIAYSADIVPSSAKAIYAINPVVGIVDSFRWALLGLGDFPWVSLGISVVLSTVVFLFGLLVFQRIEDSFADVI